MFTGESSYLESRSDIIPSQRVSEPLRALAAPVAPDIMEPISPTEIFLPDEELALVDTLPASGPILDADGNANAWLLQIGSFASRDNAEQLLQRVLVLGYRAYIRLTPGEEGLPVLYKVFVGPLLDPAEVERQRGGLTEVLGAQPLLLRYTP